MKHNHAAARPEGLARLIRSEVGARANRGVLSRLPAFAAEPALPDSMRSLLGELDRAERQTKQARG
jgi:hypothetical protein